MNYEDDDYGEELDEREAPDAEDADWNLDPSVVKCPYCRHEVSEDAPRCPHCGSYISAEDAPYQRSWWMVVGIIFLLILTALGWFWWK